MLHRYLHNIFVHSFPYLQEEFGKENLRVRNGAGRKGGNDVFLFSIRQDLTMLPWLAWNLLDKVGYSPACSESPASAS